MDWSTNARDSDLERPALPVTARMIPSGGYRGMVPMGYGDAVRREPRWCADAPPDGTHPGAWRGSARRQTRSGLMTWPSRTRTRYAIGAAARSPRAALHGVRTARLPEPVGSGTT